MRTPVLDVRIFLLFIEKLCQIVSLKFILQQTLKPLKFFVQTAVQLPVPTAIVFRFHAFDHQKRVFEGTDHIIKGQVTAIRFDRIAASGASLYRKNIRRLQLFQNPVYKR